MKMLKLEHFALCCGLTWLTHCHHKRHSVGQFHAILNRMRLFMVFIFCSRFFSLDSLKRLCFFFLRGMFARFYFLLPSDKILNNLCPHIQLFIQFHTHLISSHVRYFIVSQRTFSNEKLQFRADIHKLPLLKSLFGRMASLQMWWQAISRQPR